MLRRAGRRWMRSLGWILLFTFVITLTVGIYIRFFEPERYIADYLLCAVPRQEGQRPAPLSMWMLLQDFDRLLDEDAFRYQIVAETASDGKTFVSARGNAGDHMVTIRAVGQDEQIVTGLANAVGDRLAADAERMLGLASVETVHRAELLPQPGPREELLRTLAAMLISFGLFSLLAVLFGSRREPVCCGHVPEELELSQLGQVADCDKACESCAARLSRSAGKTKKKAADGRLLAHVDRLVREGVAEVAQVIRTDAEQQSSSVAITGVRAEDDAAQLAVLLGQTLADEGYSVLMLEMDGDRPMLGHYLGVSGRVDVVDCLKDSTRLPYALLGTSGKNLHLIDCCHDGETVRKAAASAKCRSFVRDALTIYDYVLIHTPPASFGNGAAAIGSAADRTVLVARDARYTVKELNSLAVGLRQRAVNLIGVVFSGVRKRHLRSIYQDDGRPYRQEGKETAQL